MFGYMGTGSLSVCERSAGSEKISIQVSRPKNGVLEGAVILVAEDNADACLLVRLLLEDCRAR
jgi:hypothetical protein